MTLTVRQTTTSGTTQTSALPGLLLADLLVADSAPGATTALISNALTKLLAQVRADLQVAAPLAPPQVDVSTLASAVEALASEIDALSRSLQPLMAGQVSQVSLMTIPGRELVLDRSTLALADQITGMIPESVRDRLANFVRGTQRLRVNDPQLLQGIFSFDEALAGVMERFVANPDPVAARSLASALRLNVAQLLPLGTMLALDQLLQERLAGAAAPPAAAAPAVTANGGLPRLPTPFEMVTGFGNFLKGVGNVAVSLWKGAGEVLSAANKKIKAILHNIKEAWSPTPPTPGLRISSTSLAFSLTATDLVNGSVLAPAKVSLTYLGTPGEIPSIGFSSQDGLLLSESGWREVATSPGTFTQTLSVALGGSGFFTIPTFALIKSGGDAVFFVSNSEDSQKIRVRLHVTPKADVAVEFLALPGPLKPGESATATAFVSNLGPSDAKDVTVNITVNSADAITSVPTGFTISPDGKSATGSLGTLTGGQQIQVPIGISVSAPGNRNLEIGITGSSTTGDPQPGNESADLSVPVALLQPIEGNWSGTGTAIVSGTYQGATVTIRETVTVNASILLNSGLTTATVTGTVDFRVISFVSSDPRVVNPIQDVSVPLNYPQATATLSPVSVIVLPSNAGEFRLNGDVLTYTLAARPIVDGLVLQQVSVSLNKSIVA